jgi:hypothetical protein
MRRQNGPPLPSRPVRCKEIVDVRCWFAVNHPPAK